LLYSHPKIAWCREEGVRHAIFSHCGSEIVTSDAEMVGARVRLLGMDAGVNASIAHDGLRITL
jgi:hypothetical protein